MSINQALDFPHENKTNGNFFLIRMAYYTGTSMDFSKITITVDFQDTMRPFFVTEIMVFAGLISS